MGIAQYLKEIGRGKDGARALTREQAADLFAQVLDRRVSDLEIGAFCLAMRIKGETPEEMSGFLDAARERVHPVPAQASPVVVLPSYNGARKLPALTALLAFLLAREGLPVLVHGVRQDPGRVATAEVLSALGVAPLADVADFTPGRPHFCPIDVLSPALAGLLEVRRVIGLRNPAHSLVKLMNPCAGAAIVVGSYTHPEYALSMAATFELTGSNALLLRGTEGEPVADARRTPKMEGFVGGRRMLLQEQQAGPLAALPDLPAHIDAGATARFIQSVLDGALPVPEPIARQREQILHLARLTQSADAALKP